MMEELSMHILDIAENSITASATDVYIEINEDTVCNTFVFTIKDNGCGMNKEMVENVRSPFTTSRTTRRVGLGIPFLEQTCIQCNGNLLLESEEGTGTTLIATMHHDHIDRPPLGDIASTMQIILCLNENINFIYKHVVNGNEFVIDTKEIKDELDGVPLNQPDVMLWMKETVQEGLQDIKQGL